MLAQSRDGNWRVAQRGRGAGFELPVDLRCHLFGSVAITADARPTTDAFFLIAEIPNGVAEIAFHLADAERSGLGYVILREPSCHKVPQKLPQIAFSGNDPGT